MNGIDILIDSAGRPAQEARAALSDIGPQMLNAHPGGHPNSIAWLLWHSGRETDAQLADLSGSQQVWHRDDVATRTGLADLGEAAGYGFTAEQARAVTARDVGVLLEYLDAVTEALIAYLRTLTEADLDQVIDENWDPPVTRGVRLVSIIDDAAQHVGQAAYVAGTEVTG
jgi:hypothetical protein